MTTPISAVTMPKWGIEMTEGTIAGWRVQVGEHVARGAEIVDVETEKIVNTVESPAAGVLRRIVADQGETRAVGALIGVIADAQTGDAEIDRFIASFVGAVVSFEPTSDGVAGTPPAMSADAGNADEARVSPIARRVAERLQVDLSKVTGTGRNGRISKEDVEAHAAKAGGAGSPPPVQAPSVRRLQMSGRRATIARRLLESKQSIPHFRLDIEADFGPIITARRGLASTHAERVTLNDLLLRAVALALVQHPMVNAQLLGEEIVQFQNADIAIAVSADAGLITPVLRDVNLKPLAQIARESRDLIERARQGTLQREEISGGSFTISNLGMFGISRFDAIINAPQVAILAVGAVTRRAVVREGAVVAADLATLTLSADHRVVDGAVGAAFLATLQQVLGKPEAL